eukprot:215256_1
MALALYDQDNDFDLSKEQTVQLLSNTGIATIFEEKYSDLNKVVIANPRGAIKLLLARGAISIKYGKEEFDIIHDMHNDSVGAWSQYKEHVLTYLSLINDTADLKKARIYIRDLICDEWERQAPNWADEGEWGNTYSQSINEEGEVPTAAYTYIWSCVGTIKMRDYCYERNNRFKAEIWGNPAINIKCLRLNKYELKKWNEMCAYSLDYVKQMANGAEDKPMSVVLQKMKQISWD